VSSVQVGFEKVEHASRLFPFTRQQAGRMLYFFERPDSAVELRSTANGKDTYWCERLPDGRKGPV
jgi:hypothetical protein